MSSPAVPPPLMPMPASSAPATSPFVRLWRGLMAVRVLIALFLFGLQFLLYETRDAMNAGLLLLCLVYLCATAAAWRVFRPTQMRRDIDLQWGATAGVDFIAFAALHLFQADSVDFSLLFAVPVLQTALLGPRPLALGTAAAAALTLLALAAWDVLSLGRTDIAPLFLRASLTGAGVFAVAIFANGLAQRLAQQEKTARASRRFARVQREVNALVIESLSSGVLVIDERRAIWAINPTAQAMFGVSADEAQRPHALVYRSAWAPVYELVRQTLASGESRTADVLLDNPAGGAWQLRVKTRPTPLRPGLPRRLCVVFMEDWQEIAARMRTEKMAAMGRMSAAVAHEIRNPLAAISQANALLDEEVSDVGQRQLTQIVGQNALRLARIVDEVLSIFRLGTPDAPVTVATLALRPAVGRVCAEWVDQNAAHSMLTLPASEGDWTVQFEEDHLRRLIVNLLDNALRHCSKTPGAIELCCRAGGDGRPRLSVWSDGTPITPVLSARLFEPFYSTGRSTGLGLYICRELCERHGAVIGHSAVSRRQREGNEFHVDFALAPVAAGASGTISA